MTRLIASALFLALIVLAFAVGRASSTPRSAIADIPAALLTPVVSSPRSESEPRWRSGAPSSPPSPVSTQDGGSASLTGIASWGYGWADVVTRLHRGTPIRVCGPLACWSGRSIGYGPAVWTGRIADLSRSVFAAICGDPAKGLCRVRLSW